MNLHIRTTTWTCWTLVALLTPWASAQTTSQPALSSQPAKVESNTGVVTGDNVYVRSGSDQGYYPVTKLNKGEPVTVVGRQFGWLEIAPPEGTHSVVNKTFVDRLNDKEGVLNGTAWAYAGSNLDKRRYAKQVTLKTGDHVSIIGETSDGMFYKITPPKGATLWISNDFVDRSGHTEIAPSPTMPIERIKPGELQLPGKEERPALSGPGAASRPAETPTVPGIPEIAAGTPQHQEMINAIEAEIAAEVAKPMADRQLEGIIAKLQPLGEQEEDEVTKAYAQMRLRQLERHLKLVSVVQEMHDLRDNALAAADELERERQKIIAEKATPPDDIIVRGEIRVSGIYDGTGNRPKRWRIVEAGTTPTRTLAYIEVPSGSPIDPVQYYGKFVGIRAAAYRVPRGTAPPVPVYTVEEIRVLDPASTRPASATSQPSR